MQNKVGWHKRDMIVATMRNALKCYEKWAILNQKVRKSMRNAIFEKYFS